MKRTAMPPRKAPMKRSAFKSVARLTVKCLPESSKVVSGKRMRRSRPKMTPIRKSAKDEDCTLRIIGVCNYDIKTTVWAHSNRIQDGKGAGIKARDEEGCYACFDCHAWLDGGWVRDKGMTHGLLQEFFDCARKKSQAILKRKGLM